MPKVKLTITSSRCRFWGLNMNHKGTIRIETDRFVLRKFTAKDINEPIGTISVVDMDERTEKVHIGYCIGSKWWNMGC